MYYPRLNADYVEGAAFDPEYQEQKRLKREQQREEDKERRQKEYEERQQQRGMSAFALDNGLGMFTVFWCMNLTQKRKG
jgi:hypothetical protein